MEYLNKEEQAVWDEENKTFPKTPSRRMISKNKKGLITIINDLIQFCINKIPIYKNNYEKYKKPYNYDDLYVKSGGVCSICGNPETVLSRSGNIKRLAVDHCHRTGKFRGLLCFRCNRTLGGVKDNPILLLKMVKYLL